MTRGHYPATRMRRSRQLDFSRRLISENNINCADLIWPMFVVEGEKKSEPVPSMPGVHRSSIDELVKKASEAMRLKIPAIAIFPSIEKSKKDEIGSLACDETNLVCRSVKAVKSKFPDLGVICDVALDPYTSHGHDGILRDGKILNDETIEILARQAVIQANAGCDIVAPSDMMDGRVRAIRKSLDDNGFSNTQIMAYAVKYNSSFYGPFRDAVGSAALLGKSDKATYQMDPANSSEAMHEIALDLAEGADSIIIKPGMPYLDILSQAKQKFEVPCITYQVSGEYSMLCAAFESGYLDRERTILETLLCFKRAGANAIFTYFAPEVAKILSKTENSTLK